MKKIYYAHYFHYEYDLMPIINRVPCIWCNLEIDKDLFMQGWAAAKGKNINNLPVDEASKFEKEANLYICSQYPNSGADPEMDCATNIICISLDEETSFEDIEDVALDLRAYAHRIADEASGDDDYFDYMPDTLCAIINILGQLGKKEYAAQVQGIYDSLDKE